MFGRLVKESGSQAPPPGTILTDVDETVAGIKRQHNVFAQLGIDPQAAFGYRILEPLASVAQGWGAQAGAGPGAAGRAVRGIPFPGPALAARVIGEATPDAIERAAGYRRGGKAAGGRGAFQYLAILHEDRVTGLVDGKRDFGQQIEVRCWESLDARTATPTRLPFDAAETVGRGRSSARCRGWSA